MGKCEVWWPMGRVPTGRALHETRHFADFRTRLNTYAPPQESMKSPCHGLTLKNYLNLRRRGTADLAVLKQTWADRQDDPNVAKCVGLRRSAEMYKSTKLYL